MIEIIHLKHNEIDKNKWDRVVASSNFALPYFFSWYLDVVSPSWEALVSTDFQYIMPITTKKKFGVKYVIQPPFTQQLGILSNNIPIDQTIVTDFLKKIPYLIYDINLNYNNVSKESKLNLILPPQNYCIVSSNYNKNTKRNISKALLSGVEIKSIKLSEFLSLLNCDECKISNNKTLLINLLNELSIKNYLFINGAFKDGELIAGLAAIIGISKMIYFAPISNMVGKKYCAMFLLMDNAIKYSMDKGYTFDFEGSMIPGVKQFYLGFGAQPQLYYRAHRLRNKKLFDALHRLFRK